MNPKESWNMIKEAANHYWYIFIVVISPSLQLRRRAKGWHQAALVGDHNHKRDSKSLTKRKWYDSARENAID